MNKSIKKSSPKQKTTLKATPVSVKAAKAANTAPTTAKTTKTTDTNPSPVKTADATTTSKPASENVSTIDLASIDEEQLSEAPSLTSASAPKKHSKKPLFFCLFFLLLLVAAGAVAWWYFNCYQPSQNTQTSNTETTPTETVAEQPKIYSKLTGLEITDEKLNDSPVFCVQIPNDTYGARPQVGLNHAAVVFEAVAEAGITRTAAIFQNLDDSVIGPIRSLRTYYLDWETPFDCTLVHAGGEEVARKTAANGNYRDLTESNTYMYRDSRGYSAPNNLFTSTALLTKFNSDHNYTSSKPKTFVRLTPTEAEDAAKEAQSSATDQASTDSDSASSNLVSSFELNFGKNPNFNTVYAYNKTTNSYDRSFANGSEHIVYNCRAGLDKPSPKKECGEPVQLSPNVVIAIEVDEYTKANKRENIQTIGSGNAYVFQNGTVTKGSWTKASQTDQITFNDEAGNLIKLTPGQVWIAAIPNAYGSINY